MCGLISWKRTQLEIRSHNIFFNFAQTCILALENTSEHRYNGDFFADNNGLVASLRMPSLSTGNDFIFVRDSSEFILVKSLDRAAVSFLRNRFRAQTSGHCCFTRAVITCKLPSNYVTRNYLSFNWIVCLGQVWYGEILSVTVSLLQVVTTVGDVVGNAELIGCIGKPTQ